MLLLFLSLLWLFIIIGIILYLKYIIFKDSSYQKESGNTFTQTVFSTGIYGEYLTFRFIERLKEGRLLTNVYLKCKDHTTTEIDLILIHKTGIYVIESKNYAGWIYGNDIYDKLSYCSHQNSQVKEKHIQHIKNTIRS